MALMNLELNTNADEDIKGFEEISNESSALNITKKTFFPYTALSWIDLSQFKQSWIIATSSVTKQEIPDYPVGGSVTAIELAEDHIRHWLESKNIDEPLRQALEDLDEVVQEASVPNWDGYGALPVTTLSYNIAKKFLMALPASMPLPEVSADPDGEISFDWFNETSDIFSVSISGSGRLAYAGVFGMNKTHGVEFFEDDIPETILFNLQRL